MTQTYYHLLGAADIEGLPTTEPFTVTTTFGHYTPPETYVPYVDVESDGAAQTAGDVLEFGDDGGGITVYAVLRSFTWGEAAEGAARVRGCSVVEWLKREGYIRQVMTSQVSNYSLDELRARALRRLKKARKEHPQPSEPRPLRGIALGGV